MSSSSRYNTNNGYGNVAGFLIKLWKLLENSNDDSITWSGDGRSFIISDPHAFSQSLSKYFKHNNLSSFIRQLNMYGFRKVATIESCGVQTDDLHFYHPNFIKGHAEQLELIKRKIPQKSPDSLTDLRNVFRDIKAIEDKQNSVNLSLTELKRENEMLWSQLHDLRRKHQKQQLYIGNFMKFVLEALEQKHGIKTSHILQLKRKNSPLMIGGSEEDSSNSPILKRKRYDPSNSTNGDIVNQSIQDAALDLDDLNAVIDDVTYEAPNAVDIKDVSDFILEPTATNTAISYTTEDNDLALSDEDELGLQDPSNVPKTEASTSNVTISEANSLSTDVNKPSVEISCETHPILSEATSNVPFDLDNSFNEDAFTQHITNTEDEIEMLQSAMIEYGPVDFSLLDELDNAEVGEQSDEKV